MLKVMCLNFQRYLLQITSPHSSASDLMSPEKKMEFAEHMQRIETRNKQNLNMLMENLTQDSNIK